MLLSGVLFVLFLAGCWLYCLTDAVLTPAREYRGLRKSTWLSIIAMTFIVGAIAWLIVRRSWRSRSWQADHDAFVTLASHGDGDVAWDTHWTAADDAVARHPAGRSRKAGADGPALKGPDDDADFLRLLDHRIRGTSADAGE
jgi:ABC-type nickel/cobalt efflux system permease component RcnA